MTNPSNNETRTLYAIAITVFAMVIEIIYGYKTNSMALLSDGYHMCIHVVVFGLTYAAYVIARKLTIIGLHKKFAERVCNLAAYTSSLFLGITGVFIITEAVIRFFNPQQINFNEAILVATIGLCVNLITVFAINTKHCCAENLECTDKGCHKDYNFKAAYYHVLADILISVLAVVALLFGKYFGTTILDPITGIFGGILIIRWSIMLITNSAKLLINA